MTFQLLSPFGPTIAACPIPDKILRAMNYDCIQQTDESHFPTTDMSNKLIGQIKVQARISPELLMTYGEHFCNLVDKYSLDVFKHRLKSRVHEGWYNRIMHPREYNPEHIHPECLITSVGYLKLPSNFKEELSKPQPNGVGGGIEFFHGEAAYLAHTKMTVIPKVGDYYIFPGNVRHTVYPMPEEITEERRSFSINFVEDK